MFRQWDDDGSGTITKKEFIKAMVELGLELSKKDIGDLFDGWDPDRWACAETRAPPFILYTLYLAHRMLPPPAAPCLQPRPLPRTRPSPHVLRPSCREYKV